MRLLEFLKKAKQSNSKEQADKSVSVEYRLLCSGELYNRKVITTDWRKSDIARVLLLEPAELSVASAPFDDYPQELCLRFVTSYETIKKDHFSHTYLPDEEIAQDMAAILTLLCRRFISVAAKVREQHQHLHGEKIASIFGDFPVAFIRTTRVASWKRRPATLVWGKRGVEDFIDHHPQPLGMAPDVLKNVLLALPELQQAEDIVLSARLYQTALQLIEHQPDISYLLLVSSVEVLANAVLKSYKPEPDEMMETKRAVYDRALKLGLSPGNAKELAIAACQNDRWISRKFRKFLIDNVSEDLWTKDTLFMALEDFLPKRENFDAALKRIYAMRSQSTHEGQPYPTSALTGMSHMVPAKLMLDFANPGSAFPPVTWFERVVGLAIRNFIKRITQVEDDIAKEVGQ